MAERINSSKLTTGALALIAGATAFGWGANSLHRADKANSSQPACVESAAPGDSLAAFQSRIADAGDDNVGTMSTSNGTELVTRQPQKSEFMIAQHVSEATCRELGGITVNSAVAETGNVIQAVRTSVAAQTSVQQQR